MWHEKWLTLQLPKQAMLFDIETMALAHNFVAQETTIKQLLWSPDGERLAVIGETHVYVLNPETGELLAKFWREYDYPSEYEMPHNFRRIRQVEWHFNSEELLITAAAIPESINTQMYTLNVAANLAFQPIIGSFTRFEWLGIDNNLVLSGHSGNGFSYSSIVESETWKNSPFRGYPFTMNHSGTTYATTSIYDNDLKLWDRNTYQLTKIYKTNAAVAVHMAWSHDDNKIATVHLNEIQVWDMVTGEQIATQLTHFAVNFNAQLAWHPDGTKIAIDSWYNHVRRQSHIQYQTRIWNLSNQQFIREIDQGWYDRTDPKWGPPLPSYDSLQVWDDGLSITFPENHGRFTNEQFYDANDCIYLQESDELSHCLPLTTLASQDEYNVINNERWHPEQNIIAYAVQHKSRSEENNGFFMAWNVESQTILFESPMMGWAHQITWSPNGDYLAWMSRKELIVYRRTNEGNSFEPIYSEVRDLDNEDDRFFQHFWHPNNDWIIMSYGGKYQLKILEMPSGNPVATIELPAPSIGSYLGGIFALAWSPIGQKLATVGVNDTAIRIWELVPNN